MKRLFERVFWCVVLLVGACVVAPFVALFDVETKRSMRGASKRRLNF